MFSHINFKPTTKSYIHATITDKEELLLMNSFASVSKHFMEKSVVGQRNLKAFRKYSYMQILTITIFDFSMDSMKVVEVLSETEGTQNLSGQVIKLLS